MQASRAVGIGFLIILPVAACSRADESASSPAKRADVLALVLDSAQSSACGTEARAIVRAAGAGPYECFRRVRGGRAYLRFGPVGRLSEATRFWDVPAEEAPAVLDRERAALVGRLGPARRCFDRLSVWTGADWHAVLALRGPDALSSTYPAEQHAVTLIVRPSSDSVCPDGSEPPET